MFFADEGCGSQADQANVVPRAPRNHVALRRVDGLLVERGLADSRERAQALVAAGLIEVDQVRVRSAALMIRSDANIRIIGREHPWASRGGLKLAAALDQFNVNCCGRVAIDGGAATGGFTDVLLSRGVRAVYAVDVGRGLLDPRLAGDARVTVMDGTNLRTLSSLPGPAPNLATLDLSFISLREVLPAVTRVAPGAEVVALFKPQFEVDRAQVGAGGVVRDVVFTSAALDAFRRWADATLGAAELDGPVAAAVKGAKGNQEWLVHLRLGGQAPADTRHG